MIPQVNYYPQHERLDFIDNNGLPMCGYYGYYAKYKLSRIEQMKEKYSINYIYDSKINDLNR